MMKKLLLGMMVGLTLTFAAAPAFAQDDTFCGIPEGCDLDGDGTVDVPGGTPIPSDDQYGSENTNPDVSAPIVAPTLEPVPGEESAPGAVAVPGDVAVSESEDEDASQAPLEESSTNGTSAVEDEPVEIAVLPDTGGVWTPLLGASVLLLVGGVFARKIIK